jgi:hypothetical protein
VLAEDGTMVDNAKAVSPALLAEELDRKAAAAKPVASR